MNEYSLPASVQEFELSLDMAQNWAASVGYDENEVNDIIKSVRKNKKTNG